MWGWRIGLDFLLNIEDAKNNHKQYRAKSEIQSQDISIEEDLAITKTLNSKEQLWTQEMPWFMTKTTIVIEM